MAEDRVEVGEGQPLNVDLIMQSIKQTEVWWKALQEVMQGDKEGVISFIEDALRLYEEIEEAALNPEPHLPITPEDASKIKALWVISAPGTYFKASKKDRYEDKPWAAWNDRQRVNYALHLGRKLAEVRLGHKLSESWSELEREIKEEGPMIIYSGRPDEAKALFEAAQVPWLRFPQGLSYPKDSISIIEPEPDHIDNLLDQIRTFQLPEGMRINKEDEIGVAIHAPQAVRLLYSLNNSRGGLTEKATLRIFPLPTPKEGIPEYPLQEIRGLINYRFIADPPNSADTPYPYRI